MKKLALCLTLATATATATANTEPKSVAPSEEVQDLVEVPIPKKADPIIKIRNAYEVIREKQAKRLEDLTKQVKSLEEEQNRQNMIMFSDNKSLLSVTNIITEKNLDVAIPAYTKSISYRLGLDFAKKSLFLDTIYEGNTLNSEKNFIIPFACYVNPNWTCNVGYEINFKNGEYNKGSLVMDRDQLNSLKFQEEDFQRLIENIDAFSDLKFIIYTFPFQSDQFTFSFE